MKDKTAAGFMKGDRSQRYLILAGARTTDKRDYMATTSRLPCYPTTCSVTWAAQLLARQRLSRRKSET